MTEESNPLEADSQAGSQAESPAQPKADEVPSRARRVNQPSSPARRCSDNGTANNDEWLALSGG